MTGLSVPAYVGVVLVVVGRWRSFWRSFVRQAFTRPCRFETPVSLLYTVELLNKETLILQEEVAIETDFIMGRRSEDHKTRIIPFSAIGALRLD